MSEKILPDTSAWILGFKKTGDSQLREFMKASIRAGLTATSEIIILELLQGCRTERERDNLRTKLEILEMLPVSSAIWERAYDLGFSLRRKGLTIPTVDIIVASIAIENDCIVVHHDRHYELIAQNYALLRTRHFPQS